MWDAKWALSYQPPEDREKTESPKIAYSPIGHTDTLTTLLLTYQGALHDYPDNELIRRIASQDEKALDMLYARYSIPLYSLLQGIVVTLREIGSQPS